MNECEAGGGDRILFVYEFFFFLTYLRVYLHTCIYVYVHVYMCGQYVMCTICICKLCYLLWSLCRFFFVCFFPSLTLPACGLRSS